MTDPRHGTETERQALVALRRMRERLEVLESALTEPLAVIGVGCRFPGAAGPAAFWDLLRRGGDAVRPIAPGRWDVERFSRPDPTQDRTVPHFAGHLEGVDLFDAEFFGIAGREAQLLDPQQRLLLEVAWEALEGAGIPPLGLRGSRTGVFVGITTTDYLRLLTQRMSVADIDAYLVTGNTPSGAAGRVAYHLGLEGPAIAIDSACSSSLSAVDRACRSVRTGECRLAIAAGVSLMLSPEIHLSMARWGMLSPDGRCKTFDASADGFVRGEGCGVVLLKRLSHALADGDRVCALVRGTAMNQDGASSGFTVPNGVAQARVIREALEAGGVAPRIVGYVEAHGAGTPIGDPIEVEAIAAVYGVDRDPAHPLRVGAVKTNLGHMEAASGIGGLIKTILALQHRQIPANLHFRDPSPSIPWNEIPVRVPTALEPWEPIEGRRLAGVSSFGFIGTNAHVVLEEAPPPAPVPDLVRPLPHLLTLSARSPTALDALAASYAGMLEGSPSPDAGAVCLAASASRSHHPVRLAVSGADAGELARRLRGERADDEGQPVVRGRVTGSGPNVAFLFTGQGAQYPGMGRGLAEANPAFRTALEHCAEVMAPLLDQPLLDLVFGAPSAGDLLHQTAYTQPALFALEWALAEMWRSFGVVPSCVIGHSAGELVAACCAGVLSLEDAAGLVVLRGRLMQALPAGGAMAAVFATEAHVRSRMADLRGLIGFGGINGPEEVVVSGEQDAVHALHDRLTAEGVRVEVLRVSHASHSPLMRPMVPAFEAAAREVPRAPRTVRVVSTLTGALADPDWASADYWARQLQSPVRYADAIRTAVAGGVDVAIEIGPHPVLTGMGMRGLPTAGVSWLPTLRRERDDWTTVTSTLAELYVRGAVGDWSGEEGSRVRTRVTLPAYPFQRSRLWLDAPASKGRAATATGDWRHPLLGWKLPLALEESVFQVEAGHARHRSLRDHRVRGRVVWPGTATIEMALAAVRESFGPGPLEVRDLELRAPVVLPDEGHVMLQTVVRAAGPEECTIQFAEATDDDGDRWVTFATARGRVLAAAPGSDDRAGARARCTQAIDPDQLYARLERAGLQLGPAFRSVQQGFRAPGEACGKVSVPAAVMQADAGIGLHPALLDGCFHLAFVAAGGADDESPSLLVPAGVERLTWYGIARGAVWAHAIARAPAGSSAPLFADLTLWDEDDRLVAKAEGVRFVRAPMMAIDDLSDELVASAGYGIAWRRLPADGDGTAEARRWLFVAGNEPLARKLEELVRREGGSATVLRVGDSASDERVAAALRDGAARLGGWPEQVVLLAGAGALRTSLETALALVHASAASGGNEPCRLWFVTRGAQAVRAGEGADPDGAALWGLARVARAEHPELACTALDVDGETEAAALHVLLRDGDRAETQVALREGVRWGARFVRSDGAGDMRLTVPRPGRVEDVELTPFRRRAPAAGEVRIDVRAAGLNFRDLLCALGLYPGEVQVLGGECAGVVSAVGPGVSGLAVGDEVMALAPGGLATSVVVPAGFVARKPDTLDLDQAAALPVAYMTASLGLERLAGLRPGERVLIHSATGGVGLAAVQIAQALGAEIYATAGSKAKRDLLVRLGVAQVYDSRTPAFAEAILARTGGRGVDVLLNSLTGELLTRSYALVARGGRILEMGKRDLPSAEAVARDRPGVSFLPFDLGEMAARNHELASSLLATLVRRVGDGTFPPLPVETYSLANPHEAFRVMAMARHVGKLVLRQDIRRHTSRGSVREDGTYLITGGFGFLGLRVARGLASRGARHLVLAGRRLPGPEAAKVIARLSEDGVSVRAACLDVADAAALQREYECIRDSMPPLRGVIHAAGLLDDGVLAHQRWSRFEAVLRPKLAGAANLDALTRDLDLDFFLMFSAGAAWLGAAGQGNYAAANAAMDALAHARRAAGRPAMSVAWGRWAGGLGSDGRTAAEWDVLGLGAIPLEPGVDAMFDLLAADAASVAILPIKWSRFLAKAYAGSPPRFFAEVVDTEAEAAVAQRAPLVARLEATPPGQRRDLLRHQLDGILRRVIGIPADQVIDPRLPLQDLGIDSLMTVELRNAVSRAIERPLPATLVFDHPTLDALGAHLLGAVLGLESSAARTIDATPDALHEVQALSEEEAETLLLRELAGGMGT